MNKLLLLLGFFLLPALSIAQGIDRIAGSPYPASAQPDTLYSVTDANFSESQLLTIETLQGVLAQTKPEIYRISSSSYATWLDDLKNNYGVTVINTYDGDFRGLIEHFESRIHGYIVCDLQDSSVNTAISLCGITGSVAITTSNIAFFDSTGIPMTADVRGKGKTWFFSNYGSEINKRDFCFQNETKDAFLADYSVFGRMATFYSAALDSSTESLFGTFDSNAAMFGWGPDEHQTVSAASSHNAFVNGSDFSNDLSALSNFNASDVQKPPYDSLESRQNVHTVCFLMTDGDNVQWIEGGFTEGTSWYGSPDRGKLKLGWTISPALCELAPTVMKYLYDNESSGPDGRDYFVAGASGVGYMYPDKYPDLDSYARLTAAFMKKADLRIINILGNNDSDQYLEPFLSQKNIDAIIYYFYSDYSGGRGEIKWIDGKPVIYGRYNLWSGFNTPTSLAEKLNAAPKNIYSPEGYSLIPVHVWSMTVDSVLSCIRQLDSTVRVVTPDEFVRLVRQNLAPRTDIVQFTPNGSPEELKYLVPGDSGTAHNLDHRWANYSDKIVYKFNMDSLLSLSNGVQNLFLNFVVGNQYLISVARDTAGPWEVVYRWSSDSTQHIHDLSNYGTRTVNLQEYFDEGWHTLCLKFEDGIKTDAFGPSVYQVSVSEPQIPTSVESDNISIPRGLHLYQNYPNPFNPATVISYVNPKEEHVTLRIYDVLGRQVSTLVNANQQEGKHSVVFNGAGLASGVYFYRLVADGEVVARKMLLLK